LGDSTLDSYQKQNLQNAIRAQEHNRWVTSHLLMKWLPMKKEDFHLLSVSGELPEFKTKDKFLKRHICITSQDGLKEVSSYMAKRASHESGRNIEEVRYEFFKNDDMSLINSENILSQLKFSITEINRPC